MAALCFSSASLLIVPEKWQLLDEVAPCFSATDMSISVIKDVVRLDGIPVP